MTNEKDYTKVAEILAQSYRASRATSDNISEFAGQMQLGQLDRLSDQFADWFASDNPRFDRERFLAAARKEV